MSRRSRRALLLDMREAGQMAVSTIAGRDATALREDSIRTLGLVKCLEIVGEAAGCLSLEFRTRHSDLPWAEIIGMRNRLVHAYYEIDCDLLWKTLTEDLPPFLARIEELLVNDSEGEA
jgi:uncharacterized protein with HEPN domain